VLLDSCNLWVYSLETGARRAGKADFSGITLESTVDESGNLAIDIARLFCVGESLVGCG
jgi:hypothetical protein